jgi:tetratricopeptide (TPR) repeat protein
MFLYRTPYAGPRGWSSPLHTRGKAQAGKRRRPARRSDTRAGGGRTGLAAARPLGRSAPPFVAQYSGVKQLFLAPTFLAPALLLALASFGSVAAAAPPPFSDRVCPEATVPVRTHDTAISNPNTSVDEAIAADARVSDAYDRCASDKLTSGSFEAAHYAQLRSAQYHYELGHWQGLVGNANLAREQYQMAIKMVNVIIDWQATSQPYYQSNDVNVGSGSVRNAAPLGSDYKQAAIEVRDASVKALAGLTVSPAAGAPPAGQAPPAAVPPVAPVPAPGATGK